MTTFTRTWNAAYEQLPADNVDASGGANRIRDFKTDIQERVVVDHSFAGNADDGMHKQVTFVDPLAAKPTQANDETYLYTKDVSGTSELFFEDESGNEVQLTYGGVHGVSASETVSGSVELATDAETVTGSDTTRAVTPANLVAKMSAPGAIGDTTPSTIDATTIDASGDIVFNGGDVIIGKAAADAGATAGHDIYSEGPVYHTKNNGIALYVNRLATDGTVVEILQDGTAEGAIYVSGTTVSFIGAHLSFVSQLPSTYKVRRDDSILRGTVMEYANELAEWHYEDWTESEHIAAKFVDIEEKGKKIRVKTRKATTVEKKRRLVVDGASGGTGRGAVHKKTNTHRMRCQPSSNQRTKRIAGVFDCWDDDNVYDNKVEDGNTWDYDFFVATTGDFLIRVTGPCGIGDLLESNGDGTATVQADDIVRSSTIAKVAKDFLHIQEGVEIPVLVPCQLLNG